MIIDIDNWNKYVKENNIEEMSIAHHYLGITKNKYSNEELEYIITEMIKDIMQYEIFDLASRENIDKTEPSINVNDYYVKIKDVKSEAIIFGHQSMRIGKELCFYKKGVKDPIFNDRYFNFSTGNIFNEKMINNNNSVINSIATILQGSSFT